MRRIKTGNKRRKSFLSKRNLGPLAILETYELLIDSVENDKVYVRVFPLTNVEGLVCTDKSKEMYGTIRTKLFNPYIAHPGHIFTLTVWNDRKIVIEPVLMTKEAIEQGKERAKELIELLKRLKGDEDYN